MGPRRCFKRCFRWVSTVAILGFVTWTWVATCRSAIGQVFVRGDVNMDGEVTSVDALLLQGHMFLGDPPSLPCEHAADAEDDGRLDIRDAVRLLEWVSRPFLGLGTRPTAPFPDPGPDPPPPDALHCDDDGIDPPREDDRYRLRWELPQVLNPGDRGVELFLRAATPTSVEGVTATYLLDTRVFEFVGADLESTDVPESLRGGMLFGADVVRADAPFELLVADLVFFVEGFRTVPGPGGPPGAVPREYRVLRVVVNVKSDALLPPFPPRRATADDLAAIVVRGHHLVEFRSSFLVDRRRIVVSQPEFIRGDVNLDGLVNADDVSCLARFFSGEPTIRCADSADANDDGIVDRADLERLREWVFQPAGRPPPLPPPFPVAGPDPTRDRLGCNEDGVQPPRVDPNFIMDWDNPRQVTQAQRGVPFLMVGTAPEAIHGFTQAYVLDSDFIEFAGAGFEGTVASQVGGEAAGAGFFEATVVPSEDPDFEELLLVSAVFLGDGGVSNTLPPVAGDPLLNVNVNIPVTAPLVDAETPVMVPADADVLTPLGYGDFSNSYIVGCSRVNAFARLAEVDKITRPEEILFNRGDVNQDGLVTPDDYLALARFLGRPGDTSVPCVVAADVVDDPGNNCQSQTSTGALNCRDLEELNLWTLWPYRGDPRPTLQIPQCPYKTHQEDRCKSRTAKALIDPVCRELTCEACDRPDGGKDEIDPPGVGTGYKMIWEPEELVGRGQRVTLRLRAQTPRPAEGFSIAYRVDRRALTVQSVDAGAGLPAGRFTAQGTGLLQWQLVQSKDPDFDILIAYVAFCAEQGWDADCEFAFNGEHVLSVVVDVKPDVRPDAAISEAKLALFPARREDFDDDAMRDLTCAFTDEGKRVLPEKANSAGLTDQEWGFTRCDADCSGVVDLTDPIVVLSFLFLGSTEAICCEDAGDCNDDGKFDLTDGITNLEFQLLGSHFPPPPGAGTCGDDPTEDCLTSLPRRDTNDPETIIPGCVCPGG